MTIYNQCHQTCKCANHVKPFIGRKRHRYIGPFIPLEISRPIRAGLLYGVDSADLQSLIVSLLIRDYTGPDEDSIQIRETRARFYINLVSGFTVPEMTDNCFWGDALPSNKRRNSKRNRDNQGIHSMGYSIISSFLCSLS